jgi:predicted GTPase
MAEEVDTLKMLARAVARLETLVDRLPVEVAKDLCIRIAMLRTLVLEMRPPALVVVGRRGAGKSSLVNALFGAKVAELGHVTAQTGRGRWYDYTFDGGALSILDTRGLQEGAPPAESDDASSALESITVALRARPADLVVFVIKANDVDSAVDADLDALERIYDEIRAAQRIEPPLVAVVTHCDLLEPKTVRLHVDSMADRDEREEKLQYVATAERALATKIDMRSRLRELHVATHGVSAYMSWRADGALRAVVRWRIGDLGLTLFRHMPDAARAELARVTRARAVQNELATTLTNATATVCAGIAAVPMPVADIIPLTTLQAGLVATIAWVGGRTIDAKGAAEFLTSLSANVGVAFTLREAVRALLKIVAPGGGLVVSATIAFAGTVAVGAAARAYFIDGVSLRAARRVFRRSKKKGSDESA